MIARGTAGGREPSVYCSRTRCCAIRFVEDESRALFFGGLYRSLFSSNFSNSSSVKLFCFLFSLVSKTAAETASEYDSCAHRRCWTAAASCPYYSCRRRAKAVGLVLPSVYCTRTRCCAIRFVDDESRALVSFVSLVHTCYVLHIRIMGAG